MSASTGFNDERALAYDNRVHRQIPGYEVLQALSETLLAAELPETARLLIGDVAPQRGLAAASLADDVYQAERGHGVGAVAQTILDQRSGGALAEPAAEKAVAAHAREQVEQDLGHAELGAAFGDDDILGQHGLDAAADGVALDEGRGRDRQIERDVIVLNNGRAEILA